MQAARERQLEQFKGTKLKCNAEMGLNEVRTYCETDASGEKKNPHWRDYPLFYEYFHGDTGRGVEASHQTGWTALVAKLLEQTEGR